MPENPAESDNPAPLRLERLHKVLAFAGIDSRRKCEALIQEGRVEVDGKFVTELGMKVDPEHQEILVDGQRLKFGKRVYYMLNKPPGVLSTNFDPAGRTRVIDMVPQDVRLFTIGRLDRASEGLIVVTNDGELANRLAHPRYEIEKTYRVEVAGHPEPDAITFVRRGVHLAEGFVQPVSVVMKRKNKQSTTLEVILDEGKNREIRRLMAKIGHKVLRLKRIAMGPLRLGEMPEGAFRELKSAETKALRDAAFGVGAGKPKKPKPRKSSTPGEREGPIFPETKTIAKGRAGAKPTETGAKSRATGKPTGAASKDRSTYKKSAGTGSSSRAAGKPAGSSSKDRASASKSSDSAPKRTYGKTIGGDSPSRSYDKKSGPPTKSRSIDKSAGRPSKSRGFSESFGSHDDDDDDEGRPISELGWSSEKSGGSGKKSASRTGGAPKKKFAKKGTGFKGAPKKGGPKKGGPKKGAPKKKKSTFGQASAETERGGRKSKRGGTRTKYVKNPDDKKKTFTKKKTKRRK
ncbi:pseudouridine synthase [Blastopirellula marina]|uniref:Pseudouridine synthase n=1 Tax=Blastopirellula marina DSM 3645 TaxID=314230 RepID=A3ZQL4_9BACT|nr:pseudouridine synthase [Blastopirellula marina]EAQ80952.1 ribosomal large subunit pseudouridine synthase B [Blastopirellula marina DSM 3645]